MGAHGASGCTHESERASERGTKGKRVVVVDVCVRLGVSVGSSVIIRR